MLFQFRLRLHRKNRSPLLKTLHAPLLVHLHAPLLAPDISEPEALPQGRMQLGLLAVSTVPGFPAVLSNETGHLPVLPHLNVTLGTPYRPRRNLLPPGAPVASMFACPARVRHLVTSVFFPPYSLPPYCRHPSPISTIPKPAKPEPKNLFHATTRRRNALKPWIKDFF